MALDLLFRPSPLTPIILVVLYTVYNRIQKQKREPKGVPRADEDEQFKKAKSMPEKLLALKQNYSDKGLSFLYRGRAESSYVVLPPSEIPWIISQPETVLSAQEIHREQLQSDWTFLNENIVKNPIHEHVIRSNMVRKLDAFTDPVLDELKQCFEDYWGSSTDWHEVNVWNSMLKMFARTSNRMFVGLPLCRNEEFLDGCRNFAQSIMISSFVLSLLPKLLKPVLGYIAITPNAWYYRKAGKYLLPLIESRLAKLEQSPEKDPADLLPNDFVTWSIIASLESDDLRERTPELIAKRTMTTNFAAIHTTTMTSTNMLLDLLGSDPKLGYLEALEAEIAAIGLDNHGNWSKASLASMTRTDSALRESMRLSGFVSWGVTRKVIAREGVALPDGTKIPYWTNIAVPAWAIHHDDRLYEDPSTYDALRFSRQREALNDHGQRSRAVQEDSVKAGQGYAGSDEMHENGSVKILAEKNLSTVSTGSQFMQFGHGKRSCPGRFFAVQEIKLMMAYMLQEYEVEYLKAKPVSTWMGAFSMPNTSAKIRVRRRVEQI